MLEKEVKNNMKCKKNYCDGDVERAEEFGRCNKCGTIYRFDESGYYFVKNEDDPTKTKDKEIIEDKMGLDLIMDSPVVFGLLRQGHIPTIEIMLKDGATWEEIGKEIGWCPETAKEHYSWHVEALEKHLPPLTKGDSTCDVCGKPMHDDEGHDCIALHVEVLVHPEADRVLKIFGKQAFDICFVCFLRMLGVKELNTEEKTVERP